jgi:hypothetical protein
MNEYFVERAKAKLNAGPSESYVNDGKLPFHAM